MTQAFCLVVKHIGKMFHSLIVRLTSSVCGNHLTLENYAGREALGHTARIVYGVFSHIAPDVISLVAEFILVVFKHIRYEIGIPLLACDFVNLVVFRIEERIVERIKTGTLCGEIHIFNIITGHTGQAERQLGHADAAGGDTTVIIELVAHVHQCHAVEADVDNIGGLCIGIVAKHCGNNMIGVCRSISIGMTVAEVETGNSALHTHSPVVGKIFA